MYEQVFEQKSNLLRGEVNSPFQSSMLDIRSLVWGSEPGAGGDHVARLGHVTCQIWKCPKWKFPKVEIGKMAFKRWKGEGTQFGMGQASQPDPTGSEAGTRSEPAEDSHNRR